MTLNPAFNGDSLGQIQLPGWQLHPRNTKQELHLLQHTLSISVQAGQRLRIHQRSTTRAGETARHARYHPLVTTPSAHSDTQDSNSTSREPLNLQSQHTTHSQLPLPAPALLLHGVSLLHFGLWAHATMSSAVAWLAWLVCLYAPVCRFIPSLVVNELSPRCF